MTRLERSDRIAQFVLITAVIAGCVSPFALGAWNEESDQPKPQASARLFSRFDSNHDGAISAAEAAQVPSLIAVFARADVNQDGRLSRTEFISAWGLLPAVAVSNNGVTAPVQLALGEI